MELQILSIFQILKMFQQLLKLNIKAIRCFIAVVECEGVSAAQAKLNLSQSVISTNLKQLEEQIGVCLCERGRGGFRLTEEGKAVYEACISFSEASSIFNQKMHYIKQLDFSRGGHVRLAIADQLPLDFRLALQKVLAQSYQENPEIHFSIRLQSPVTMASLIATNECDIGIGYFDRMIPDLTYEFALNEKQQLYCGNAHPLFNSQTPSLDILEKDYAWVERSYKAPSEFSSLRPKKLTATAYHMEGTLHFILAGTHIGFLPVDIATPYVEEGKMYPLLPSSISYQVAHQWVYKAPLNPAVALFFKHIRQTLQEQSMTNVIRE